MSRAPSTRGARPRTKQRISDKLPKVRIRRAWHQYPVGAVIQPPGTLRSVLVNRGIAEVIDEEPQVNAVVVEADAKEPEEPESEIVTDRDEIEKPKRRGRPRKTDKTGD